MLRVLVSIGVVQILIMVVALVRAKVLSVVLGPAGYGIVSTIDQTVVSLVQLGALSLPFAAMKFMARSHSEGPQAFQETFTTFFRALAVLTVVAVVAGYSLFIWFPGALGSDLPALRKYFLIAILGVPATMLAILFVQTLAAAQRAVESASLNMLVQLALAVAAIAGVVIADIAGLYAFTAAMGVATTLATVLYLNRSLGLHVRSRSHGALAELRANPDIVTYSLFLYVALASYSLVMLVTRYFVFDQLGAIEAGFLQALLGVALTLAAVPNAMNAHFFAPLVNRRTPAKEKLDAANDFAAKILIPLIGGGVVVALFPRLVLTILFSSEFGPAAPALFAFVAWQCLYQITYVYLQLLVGLDDVGYYAAITCIGYACAAVSFRPLISELGLVGAAIALSLAMVISVAAITMRLRSRFHSSISRTVALRGTFCLFAVGIAGLIFGPATETVASGVALRVGYLLLVVTILWTTLNSGERQLASRLLPARRST
jgi:PST family polysaccharide transporter